MVWLYFRHKLEATRNHIQKSSTKCKQKTSGLRDNLIDLNSKTELYPSVADVLLWCQALHTAVNEDYESRILLTRALCSPTAQHILDLCSSWSDASFLKKCQEGIINTPVMHVFAN